MQKIINLQIIKVFEESKDTIGVELKILDNQKIAFLAGQYLTILFELKGMIIKRSYSIASAPHDLPHIHLAIKKHSDGFASTHLLEQLIEGKIIKTIFPQGSFIVNTNQENQKKYVMVAAGSGITPLISMIKSILFNESKSEILLFYGSRDEESIIYKNALAELENKFPNLKIVNTLSNPSENWTGIKGRITKESLQKFVKNINSENYSECEFFICGPNEMIEKSIEALLELNIEHNKIHREIYNAVPATAIENIRQ